MKPNIKSYVSFYLLETSTKKVFRTVLSSWLERIKESIKKGHYMEYPELFNIFLHVLLTVQLTQLNQNESWMWVFFLFKSKTFQILESVYTHESLNNLESIDINESLEIYLSLKNRFSLSMRDLRFKSFITVYIHSYTWESRSTTLTRSQRTLFFWEDSLIWIIFYFN